ncbi:hypothetical protein H4582DRAFT_2103468 [Lactarius indigo]|nr:hypothetical protein H4582DRAFT_2103468 [Lactarius indigo]
MYFSVMTVLLLTLFAPLFGVVYAAPNAPPDVRLRGQTYTTSFKPIIWFTERAIPSPV